jgi:protein-tyrosine phosphatase
MRNARDLGGHPTADGPTQFGVFLRADVPSGLPDADIAALLDYGVTTVVDFRGDRELRDRPSSLANVPGITYLRSPTFNDQVAFGAKPGDTAPAVTSLVNWAEKYAEMVDTCRDWVAETLVLLADAPGCALYNCTTGKDRTGLISAFLLSAAGVREEDIIADYCVSEVYLQDAFRTMLEAYNLRFPTERAAVITDPFFRTDPVSMANLLGHIRKNYGSTAAYFDAAGLPRETVERIRRKLVG